MAKLQDLICPSCKNTWSAKPDRDGLINGYRMPPCPDCGTSCVDPADHGDYWCSCGNEWRAYGNGGYVLGMMPNCPRCGEVANEA